MPQNVRLRTVGTRWDHLEPAMNPEDARTKHAKLTVASSNTYVRYPKGQAIQQKSDGTNEWAKFGTGGFTGPVYLMKQPVLVNDQGDWQLTDSAIPLLYGEWMSGSIDAFYCGYFRCEELVSSAGGTNEVQTLTLDSKVDGGTFTLQFGPYITAPIAWNETAANIKIAMLLAFPDLLTGDVSVAGSAGGPYTFTFTGAWASTGNVPLLGLNKTGYTDGGLAVTPDISANVVTTPGVGSLTGVGRIVQGTATLGIFELGAATPV